MTRKNRRLRAGDGHWSTTNQNGGRNDGDVSQQVLDAREVVGKSKYAVHPFVDLKMSVCRNSDIG